jgi:two-component system, cell cycle sensor histidine kinase and response regulator CckA
MESKRSAAERAASGDARLTSKHPGAPYLHYPDALLRNILETVPGGVVHVRADGAIVAANAEALRVLGSSYDAAEQRYVMPPGIQFLREDGTPCPAAEHPITRALASAEPEPATTIGVRRPDGHTSWALFRALPLQDEDTSELAGAIVTFLDISERKAAEAAREALEAQLRHAQRLDSIGQLAGVIAHDFNNLLQIILGNLELCDVGDTTQPLADIRTAAERARELTEGLLAFARRQPVTRGTVELGDVVRGVQRLLEPLLGKGIALELLPGRASGSISGDRHQVEQALVNLCLNARDAMPAGGRIRIGIERVRPDRSFRESHRWARGITYLALRVEDTGHGISSEQQTRIFEPFFTTKPIGAGTGLGLSVVYGVMQSHGGAVSVESAPGQGAAFTLYFPEATSSSTPAPTAPPSPSLSPGGRETILVVEDEDMIRSLVVRLLATRGYAVLSAPNGDAALELLRRAREPVALAFVDVVMPGMRGPEFVRRARELAPGLRVLFTTGYELEPVDGEGRARDPVLYKPYTPDELLPRLRELLDPAA